MPDYTLLNSMQNEGIKAPATTLDNFSARVPFSSINTDRYSTNFIGLNNEDIYGHTQGAGSQFLNGVLKGVGNVGTTFINGTAGLVYGVGKWIQDGKFSSFYDNPLTQSLDEFSKNLENTLPNYYTEAQTNAPTISATNLLSANFVADQLIKNAGFAVGAYLSGGAWSKVGGFLANSAKAIASGAGVELGSAVNTFTKSEIAALANKAGGIEKLTGMAKQAADRFLTIDKLRNIGTNAVRAGFATFGEASMEGLQAKNQYKDLLTREYQDKFGVTPSGETLDDINKEADKVGNFTMGANLLLLTATNYIQFPKIAGTFWKTERAAIAGTSRVGFQTEAGEALQQGSKEYFEAAAKGTLRAANQSTKFGRILGSIKGYGGLFFSPSEAFEEASQYVIPYSAQEYFNKGRQGLDPTIGQVLVDGTKSLLTSKNGQMSILLGGLTGGIMENFNPLMGGKMFHSVKKLNASRKNATEFANQLNQAMLGSGYLAAANESINRAKVLSADGETALKNGNRLQYEDSRTDQILNYLLPRLQYGRYDLVKADLEGLASVASTEEGYGDLIKTGMVKEDANGNVPDRQDFLDNLQSLQALANTTKSQFEALNIKYGSQTNEDGSKKYSDENILQLAYIQAKIDDYNKRIPTLLTDFNSAGIAITPLMEKVHTDINSISEQELNDLADQINSLSITPDAKEDLLTKAGDLLEISARRDFKIKEYGQVKDHPELYESVGQPLSLAEPGEPDMSKVNFNEVEEEQEDGDYKAVYNMVSNQVAGTPLSSEDEQLRDKYPKLYEALTATVDESNMEQLRERARQQGWRFNTQGNPVTPNSKSDFVDANPLSLTMTVNGVDREGEISYDPDEDKIYFNYTDESGVNKRTEVFNEDFNDGTITGDFTRTEYLDETDPNAPNRTQKRVKELIDETNTRQQEIAEEITKQTQELQDIKEEFSNQEESATFTKSFIQDMKALSDMRDSTEERIAQLQEEQAANDRVLTQLNELLQAPPTSLAATIDALEDQQRDLITLSSQNGKLITGLSNLLNSAKDLLSRFGKKLISRMSSRSLPTSPATTSIREAINKWQQSNSEDDLRAVINIINQEYQNLQNFLIKPLTQGEREWMIPLLENLQSQMSELDPLVRAKDTVAKRLKETTDELVEREEIVVRTPKTTSPYSDDSSDLNDEPLDPKQTEKEIKALEKEKEAYVGRRSKDLISNGETSEEALKKAQEEFDKKRVGRRLGTLKTAPKDTFDSESEKTPIERYFESTVLREASARSEGYSLRLNNFLNKIGIFDKNRRRNLRLMTVTRKTEEALGLKGFTDKYFQITQGENKGQVVSDENAADAPIGLVIIEKTPDGNFFIDDKGNRIEATDSNLLDKLLLTKAKAASLVWSDGQNGYSNPNDRSTEYINTQLANHLAWRQQILSKDTPTEMSFRTSIGRDTEATATPQIPIVGNIVSQQDLTSDTPAIEVVSAPAGQKTTTIHYNDESYVVKNGETIIRTEDNIQKTRRRTLSTAEKSLIKEALIYLAKQRDAGNQSSQDFQDVRTWIEGFTMLKIGDNLESVTSPRGDTINLTEKALNTAAASVGLETLLEGQYTNVNKRLAPENKAFKELTGFKSGPQFKEWNHYQEFVLSPEGGRKPLLTIPSKADRYLIFKKDTTPAPQAPTPTKTPSSETVAERVVGAENIKGSRGKTDITSVKKLFTQLQDTITNFFTQANNPALSESEQATEKNKAKSAAIVVHRVATVMAQKNPTLYPAGVSDVYKSLEFKQVMDNLASGKLKQVTAFHGSPFGFNRFSTENIGTGEGAQGFGWGLYFTDIKDIDIEERKFLQVGGEVAAANLDEAEGSTARLDDLIRAKRLSEDNTPPGFIKALTAWEKVDGEWKYELPDAQLKAPLLDFDPKNETGTVKLSDIYDTTELERAYPGISDLKVILSDKMDRLAAEYSNKVITMPGINWIENKYLFRSQLLHEIQHYVQEVEGFFPGGNPSVAAMHQHAISKGFSSREELVAAINEMEDIIQSLPDSEFKNSLKDKFEELNAVEYTNKEGHALYKRLAGEVEARNVQTRLELSDEDRRSSLLNDTADVREEDRLYLQPISSAQASLVNEGGQEVKSETVKGAITLIEGGQAVIEAMSGQADISTVLHEMAHFYFENGLTEEEKAKVYEEADTEDETDAQEFFARGFERYLTDQTEGAPKETTVTGTKGLTSIFKNLRQFMIDIYKSIAGSRIDITLSDNMKQLYQDMLGLEFSKTEAKKKGFRTPNKENNEVAKLPKQLVGKRLTSDRNIQYGDNTLVKGRKYIILASNNGTPRPQGVKVTLSGLTYEAEGIKRGFTAVGEDGSSKVIILPTEHVQSLFDTGTVEEAKKVERSTKQKATPTTPEDLTPTVAPITEEATLTEAPSSEVIANVDMTENPGVAAPTKEEVAAKKQSVRATPTKKAPSPQIEVKAIMTPEDTQGGVFIKDGQRVYIAPFFNGFVYTDESTFDAVQKIQNLTSSKSEAKRKIDTLLNKSRQLNTQLKKGDNITFTQTIDGVEQEVTYTVQKTDKLGVQVTSSLPQEEGKTFDVNFSVDKGTREYEAYKEFVSQYVGNPFPNTQAVDKWLNEKTFTPEAQIEIDPKKCG